MKDLNKLSKIQLEKLGREKGIELDRRLTKQKLIDQLTEVDYKEPSVKGTFERVVGWDYVNNCWDRNTPEGHAKYYEEFKKRY